MLSVDAGRDRSAQPRTGRRLVGAGALFVCLSSGVAGLAAPPGSVFALLQGTLRLSDQEWKALDNGEPVVRLLPETAPYEVAVAGAVRIAAPADRFVSLVRDIAHWKRGPALMQFGRFGSRPTAEDVAALTLDDADLAALQRCAKGKCDSKLAALAPDAFRRFDWKAPEAKHRAEALVRDGLLRHVIDYLTRGDAALMVYADRRISLAEEFTALVRSPLSIEAESKDVARYLERFPNDSLTGADSFIYWARETFGFKPVLSLYHVVVFQPPGNEHTLIASKQFYASRYFDISLDMLTVAHHANPSAQPSCYVAYFARSRADSLRGVFGGLKRWPVEREAARSTEKLLVRFKRLLEG